MRRLLRWTFNALAALSLLLCIATAALWVRSYWVTDTLLVERREAPPPSSSSEDGQDYGTPHYGVYAKSHGGQFGGWWGGSGLLEASGPNLRWSFEHAHEITGFATLPAEFELSTHYLDYDGAGFNMRSWTLPGWAFVLGFAVLPTVVVTRRLAAARRRRRARLGCCPACGYDLRATPDRCPECGTPAPANGTAAA
jgi:hypothetical protein